jgi:hypothetical protein
MSLPAAPPILDFAIYNEKKNNFGVRGKQQCSKEVKPCQKEAGSPFREAILYEEGLWRRSHIRDN